MAEAATDQRQESTTAVSCQPRQLLFVLGEVSARVLGRNVATVARRWVELYPRSGERSYIPLGKHFVYDLRWFHAGEALVESLESEREPFVVDA